MIDDGLTPTQRAFLQSQYSRETFGDLSPAEINALDMADYAARTGRNLGVTAEVAGSVPPGTPRQSPEQTPGMPAPAPQQPQGIDVGSMSMEQYAQLRGQLGVGRGQKEGRGIFDSVGSRSDEFTNAGRVQAGRTAWSTSNVTESPRLERRYVREEQPPTYQSAQERFMTPGNAFQL
jgi:hypothetical protein